MDKHSQNITGSLIWKSPIVSSMLRVLLNWMFPFQPWKFLALTSRRWVPVWNIVRYQDFRKVTPQAKLGCHTHGNIKQSSIFRVTEPTLDAAAVAPISSRMTCGYQACRSVWTQSWVRSITRCETKLLLNCRHRDQSLHSCPLIISLQGPRGNPVFEDHQSPSPVCESPPVFSSCKRCWHIVWSLL